MSSLTHLWTFGTGGFLGCPAVLPTQDGTLLVCGTKSGHIVAIDSDRNEHWRTPVGSKLGTWVSVSSGESPDRCVLAATEAGKAIRLSDNGTLVWASDVEAETSPFNSIGIAFGGSVSRVIVTDAKGRVTGLALDSGDHAWQFHTNVRAVGPAAIGDIDRDGEDEIVFCAGDSFIYCIDFDGKLLWRVKTDASAEFSAPILVDFGQGPRVLAGSMDDVLRCITPEGEVEWTCRGAGAGSLEIGIAAGDINADGVTEIVFVNAGRAIQAVASDGTLIWANMDSGDGDQPFAPSLVDIDGDGKLESLLVQRAGTVLRVFDSEGVQIENYRLEGTMIGAPVAADLDGDGIIEIFTVNATTGALSCFKCLGGKTDWPTSRGGFDGRASNLRTGNLLGRKTEKLRDLPAVAGPKNQLQLGSNTLDYDLPSGTYASVSLLGADGVTHFGVADSDRTVEFEILACGEYTVEATMYRDADRTPIGASSSQFSVTLFEDEQAEAERLLKHLSGIAGGYGITNDLARGTRTRKLTWHDILERLPQYETSSCEQRRAFVGEIRHFLGRLRREAELQKRRVALTAERDAPTEFLPWIVEDPWSAFAPELDVPAGDCAPRITLTTDMRGHEVFVVQIANLLDVPLEIRASLDRIACPTGQRIDAVTHLTLRKVTWVPTSTSKMGPDALPDLGEAGLVGVSATSSARLWVDVDTGDLPAGEYSTALHLRALTPAGTTWEIPIHWTVSSFELPEQMPVRFCNWGYPHSSPLRDIEEATIRDMQAHHTNVFVITRLPKVAYDNAGNLQGEVDWSEHDWILDRLRPTDMMLISPGGLHPASDAPSSHTPEWERAFSQYLPLWVTHLAEKGFGYESWAFYPVDEPGLLGGKLIDELEYQARLFKRIDPRVQVYTDPFKGMTVADLRRVIDVVDIFQLSFGSVLTEASRERYNYLKTTGKTLWTYEAYGGVKDMVGVKYYWEMIWTAWELGLTGVGYWSYCTRGVDLWQGPNPNNNDWEMVYGGARVPVPSVRVQAIRIGIEDYARMWAVQNAAETARIAGDVNRSEILTEALEEAVRAARNSKWNPVQLASLRRTLSALATGNT
ncbi:MAG: Outer membrane protein assembly factor BamB [Candidatus Latescibacteria bacterium ADurb.Bin168]|nr:MAG: Outer membrane protein assembly factor BamB [Candidatus Latescibacteria bacterium ADurb.Bin168]